MDFNTQENYVVLDKTKEPIMDQVKKASKTYHRDKIRKQREEEEDSPERPQFPKSFANIKLKEKEY